MQPQLAFNFPPPQQALQGRPAEPGAPGQTPPPFNYAEYGIPTDIGTATGSAGGSPFGILGGGSPQQAQGRLDGDDFGIFGGGGNGNNGGSNALAIPVLEDAGTAGNNNNNNNQQTLGIPLFGSGAAQGPSNDFNFANNDFNVAASDFEPFNFQNFVPPELTGTLAGRPALLGSPAAASPAAAAGKQAARPSSPAKAAAGSAQTSAAATPAKSQQTPQQRKQMYQTGSGVTYDQKKKAKRSLNEQPHEKALRDNPHSAWNILNMDPTYTNPNQGVYSYYPEYRVPA